MPKKSKIPSDCIEKARLVLNTFTRDELRSYYNEVFNKAADEKISIPEAMEKVNKDMADDLYHDCLTTANNIAIFKRSENAIRTGKASLRDIVVRRKKYLSENMEAHKHTAKQKLNSEVFTNITEDEMTHIMDPKNQESIADALDGKEINALSKTIGDKLKKYINFRNGYMILSHALSPKEIRGDRYLRQFHNRDLLLRGGNNLTAWALDKENRYTTEQSKALWVEKAKQHFDSKKSYPDSEHINEDGTVNEEEWTRLLENTFDNIIKQDSITFTQSRVVNDREAKRRKKQMQLIPKSARDFVEYNKTYGTGDLWSALQSDIEGSGNKIGIAESMGDDPYSMYLDLAKVQQDINPKGTLWNDNTAMAFKTGLGEFSSVVSSNFATLAANSRSFTGMARLGSIAIQSLSDMHSSVVFANRFFGGGYFDAYTNQLKHQFGLLAGEDAKYLAKQLKWNVDNHMGYMGRFADAQTLGQMTSKVSTKYYRTIGAEAVDKGNRQGAITTMASGLADHSHLSYAELSTHLQKTLDKFGLKDHDWDALRHRNIKVDGKSLFSLDNVSSLTKEEVKSIWEKSDKSYSLEEYKDALYRKVYSLFDVACENAVLTPGDWIKTFLYLGTKPGTIAGELLRTFAQFKGYAFTYIDRVLATGWSEADGAMAKMGWALQMFGAILPMSYASIWLENYSQGKTMPRWDDMNQNEKTKYSLQLLAPSLGMFLGIADPRNQNASMVSNFLLGPNSRFMGEALSGPLSLATGGGTEGLIKHWSNAANYMVPAQNFPVVTPLLNKALGREAYLQPGQELQPWAR